MKKLSFSAKLSNESYNLTLFRPRYDDSGELGIRELGIMNEPDTLRRKPLSRLLIPRSLISARAKVLRHVRKLLGPSEQDVMNALKECKDPELPVSIVDLGLIYGVDVGGGKITVEMTLTVRGCPLVNLISENVETNLLSLDGVDEVEVKIVWDPPWTPDRMSEDAKRILGWGV